MRLCFGAVLPATLLVAVLTAAPHDPPDVREVVARATTYVSHYQDRFQTIVADEHYVQTVWGPRASRRNYREIKSDMAMVQTKRGSWLPFRDVYEVDGKPVRNREDRLLELLLDGSLSADEQIARILQESSRYNIGTVNRTVNVPTITLLLLHPARVAGTDFRIASSGPKVKPPIVIVDFRERAAPSLIKGRNNSDLFATGRLWISGDDGHIERTEMRLQNDDVSASIAVQYRFDPKLDLWMPIEMKETYQRLGSAARTLAVAKYSGFRRFSIKVEEKVGQ